MILLYLAAPFLQPQAVFVWHTLLHTSQLLKQLCTLGDIITGVAVVLVSSNYNS